ncbi:unnamed protein product [marine sediment metagenome]|uniref:Uncharacterized protein n=1 Tax=marine sediment metagenome TaxID=412755 RepID=X0SY22_9ZZZZ
MIGYEKQTIRKTRKVGDGSPAFDRPNLRANLGSALSYTPFKSNFRWKQER